MSTAPLAHDGPGMSDGSAAAHLEAAHRAVVQAATLAPSVHNSQPWTFTCEEGVSGAVRVEESGSGHLRARDGWTPAVALADLPDETSIGVVLAGRPVCLVRSRGTVHALLDECSHGQVALSEGDVDGGFVECWLHGSRFDLTTGRPSGPPATAPVPVYPTRVIAGVIEIKVDVDRPAPSNSRDTR